MSHKKKLPTLFRSIIIILIIIILISVLVIKQYQKEKINEEKYVKTEKIYNSYGKFSNQLPGIMVLCYHRITPSNSLTLYAQKKSFNSQLHAFNVPEKDFKAQMKYLHDQHVKVISIEKMYELLHSNQPLKDKYVVLTFDDIDHTIINNAIPTVEKYHFPYTVFITTGKTHQYVEGSFMASWSDINKLNKSSLCTIGLHTNNAHYQENGNPRLLTMSLPEFKKDYQESIKALDKHLHTKPKNLFFASPYGAITQEESAYLDEQTNVKAIFSLQNDINTHVTQYNQYGRIVVTPKNFKNIKNWLKISKNN